ncbi:MAG: flagellar hook-associated protein FlgL, partial [Gammaproteobacteria bacterium]|nr:flagellar hook-associated protein FlgL [Gammaproteobacteria bacterium]
FARARLETQETALASVTDLLQRANELAIQGNNATASPNDRAAIAAEVDQLLEQMLALANTRDSNGEHLFGGLARSQAPFVDLGGGSYGYLGDSQQRLIQVSEDRRIADADNGEDIFMAVTGPGGPSAFRILYDLADGLRSGASLSSSIDDLGNVNADLAVTLESQLSEIKDLDYAEAVSRMNRQLLAFQASQQSYARLSQLSLF